MRQYKSDMTLGYIKNRALAVLVYLFMSQLIEDKKWEDMELYVVFFVKLLKTLKWQLPKGVEMHPAYYDLLKFQSNITQAAGEKTAIEKRHDFLREYFYYFKEKSMIKGDEDYKKETGNDPEIERMNIRI